MRQIPYPHPGEILISEFLEPMGITQYRLAKEIGVPQRRIGEFRGQITGLCGEQALWMFGQNAEKGSMNSS